MGELHEEPPDFDDSPLERLDIEVGPDLNRVVDEAVEALAEDRNLYQRDGRLVTVLRSDPREKTKRAAVAPGSPIIREISSATLKERLATVANFYRESEAGALLPTSPPADVVGAVLARGEWPSVRPIVGLLEAPSIRPDGSILDRPGYDDATGYVYVPSVKFPDVPSAPTREDAVRALADLAEIFADFNYAGETDGQRAAHRAVPIATLLSVIARPAIAGSVPAFAYDAPTPGSGKGLQVAALGTVGTGRAPALMNWPHDEAELEKCLAAFAIIGSPIVAFDNLTRPFCGAPLDRCLTAIDCVQLRILGKSEVPSLPWRAVVVATANNIEISGDTCRRVLLTRVDPEMERPDEREGFAHPDLLAWCLAERPRLVVAALTLLRAFVVAGRPKQPIKPFGSFEAWAALVPSAIVFAGGGDATLTRQEVQSKGDPARLALGVLLDGIATLDPDHYGLTAKELLGAVYKVERGSFHTEEIERAIEAAPIREALELLCPPRGGAQPSTHALGVVLRRHRDRVVGGRVLRGRVDRNGTTRWQVDSVGSPSAGDAGNAGDVSTFAREESVSKAERGDPCGVEITPAIPASPAPAPILPRSTSRLDALLRLGERLQERGTSPAPEVCASAAPRASNGKSAPEVGRADSHSVPREPKTSPIARLNRSAARVAAFQVGSKR
jgi:hypothetical protein